MRRTWITVCSAMLLAGAAWATEPATQYHNTGEAAPAPDNTGVNARDRNSGAKTAFDQGASKADRDITAAIRQQVVGDDSLSTNAHNVKIITDNGMVTLRGPVDSTQEKAAVESKAKSVPGVKGVTSQLEVTSSK